MRIVFTPYHKLQDHAVDIRLWDTHSTEQVYWSAQHNSYVVVQDNDGPWLTPDGVRCVLLSVNGIGEIRWGVSVSESTAGDADASQYFGLTWRPV